MDKDVAMRSFDAEGVWTVFHLTNIAISVATVMPCQSSSKKTDFRYQLRVKSKSCSVFNIAIEFSFYSSYSQDSYF